MTELSDVLADQDLLRRVGAALVGVSVAELIAEIEPSLELTQSQITGLVAALAATTPLPTGTPVIGQVPVVTDDSPLALGWGSGGGGGGGAVDSVNGQTGIVVLDAADVGAQPSDADLSALAAAGNSAVLAATTASFTTADETKLGGIEAGADVTDAANVAAAGAVMAQPDVIINGRLNLWQRGTTFAAVAHNTPVADRFVWGQSAGTAVVTVSRSAVVPTAEFTYSLKHEVTTANAAPAVGHEAHLRYAVEGYDFQSLYGRDAVLSFWVRASKTGTYSVAFTKSNTGSLTYVGEYTINAVDTWEYKTVAVPFGDEVTAGWDITNGYGTKIRWCLYAGTTFKTAAGSWAAGNFVGSSNQVNLADTVGATLYLTGVRFNPGTNVTDAPWSMFADDLARARRYYEKTYAHDTNPGTNTNLNTQLTNVPALSTNNDQSWPLGMHPIFRVEKRATPTISLWDSTGVAGTWFIDMGRACSAGQVGVNGFRIHNNTGGTVTPSASRSFGHWAAEAELL